MKLIIAFALLLTAASSTPRAVKIERDSATLGFSFSWPAEAAAIPALGRRFHAAMEKAWRESRKDVIDEQKLTKEQKRAYNPQSYLMAWSMVGQTKRLLSLQSEHYTFTGGAHPNTNYDALLWDRALGQEVNVAALFTAPGGFVTHTRKTYCSALDAERLKRRQGVEFDGEFGECPKYSELAISPVDADRDGSFETLAFVASPYTAGAYVEGEYAISLPVTPALIAAMKPAYRGSFEVHRQ